MSKRLDAMIERGHAALIEETKKEVTKAYQQEVPRARDFTCGQLPILERRLDKFHAEREILKMRLGQVTGRLNLHRSHGGDDGQLIKAYDNLATAINRYQTLIRLGRTQRKLKRKVCRTR